MDKRISWIDIAKGICIISVIIGHMGVDNINRFVFIYHLSVFYLLSGYTLKKDNISKKWVEKKFRGLMIPYFYTCLSVTIMDIFNVIVINKDSSIAGIGNVIGNDLVRSFWASGAIDNFGSISIGSRIGAIWFLPSLFFAQIIVKLVINEINKIHIQYCIAVLIAVLGYISGQFLWLPFSIQSSMFAVPFILAGYSIKENNLMEKAGNKGIILTGTIFMIGIVFNLGQIYFVSAMCEDLLITFIISISSSIFILLISEKINKCRLMEWIGKNSIYILCVHLFELETMYFWYTRIFEIINIEMKWYLLLICRLIFIFSITMIIVLIKNRKKSNTSINTYEENNGRDISIDILKGLLIILMITGHFDLSQNLRIVIYSFHMMTFVLLSGYYYHEGAERQLGIRIKKLVERFLIPYLVWGILYIIIYQGKPTTVICGISYTNKVFTDFPSVGPVYFIIMLFLIRVMYLLIRRATDNIVYQNLLIIIMSFLGYLLGRDGYWLPWSFDCAMYSLIFYHIGYLFKKYNILEKMYANNYFYFILVSIWAFMIYSGGMELAIRNYGSYSVSIAGATSAAVLMYCLSKFINIKASGLIKKAVVIIGENTLYILIIHTLFEKQIEDMIGKMINSQSVYFLFAVIFVLLLSGSVIGQTVSAAIKKISKKNTKSA